jgi:hypothetical protein
VPGVNPPAGIESDEIILATWGVSASVVRRKSFDI